MAAESYRLRRADVPLGTLSAPAGSVLHRDDTELLVDGRFGFGPSIVAAVARAHGGSVAAESEPGSSATFRIRLPLA